MALIVQRDLAEIGVDMQLESVPFEEFNRTDRHRRLRRGHHGADRRQQRRAGRSLLVTRRARRTSGAIRTTHVDRALDGFARAHRRRRNTASAFRHVPDRRASRILQPFSWPSDKITRAVSKRFQVVAPPGSDILPTIPDWQLAERRPRIDELKRITSRFVLLLAAAGILPLLVYGAVSIYSLRDATRRSVITGNENVAQARRRADRPLRSDERRHSSIGRRRTSTTRTSRSGSRIAS